MVAVAGGERLTVEFGLKHLQGAAARRLDFDAVVTPSDQSPGRRCAGIVDDTRAPEHESPVGEVAERAGVRMRHGAYQVVNRACIPVPVDAPILGPAASEIRTLRQVLG